LDELKGYGRKWLLSNLFWGLPGVTKENLEKKSVMISSLPAKIYTEHLPNISQDHH
jgi:hypothetical protein